MEIRNLLAEISREFFRKYKVTRYRMKKVSEMSDEDVIHFCHWYCEENKLTEEWREYRRQREDEFIYCDYFEEYIDEGLCADIQMIANDFVKNTSLCETIDKSRAKDVCKNCEYYL